MSDPVTNVEIEDVLSSIRRLVSEGDKARRAPAEETGDQGADAVAEPSAEESPEKFVLTPALRVATPAPEADAQAEQVPEAEPEMTQSDRASLEATIAELEAAVTRQDDEWEPDGSELSNVTSWDGTSFGVLDLDADAGTAAKSDDAETAIPINLDQPIAPWKALSTDNEAEDLIEVATPDLPETVDSFDLGNVEPEPETVEDSAISLLAEPEAGDADPIEADPVDAEPVVDSTLAFRHLAAETAQDVSDLTGRTVQDEDETLEAFLARGGGVDEDALRKMVMDIVREELHGALGERITRNVRKLVRREIMRVLNAQDMD